MTQDEMTCVPTHLEVMMDTLSTDVLQMHTMASYGAMCISYSLYTVSHIGYPEDEDYSMP